MRHLRRELTDLENLRVRVRSSRLIKFIKLKKNCLQDKLSLSWLLLL